MSLNSFNSQKKKLIRKHLHDSSPLSTNFTLPVRCYRGLIRMEDHVYKKSLFKREELILSWTLNEVCLSYIVFTNTVFSNMVDRTIIGEREGPKLLHSPVQLSGGTVPYRPSETGCSPFFDFYRRSTLGRSLTLGIRVLVVHLRRLLVDSNRCPRRGQTIRLFLSRDLLWN